MPPVPLAADRAAATLALVLALLAPGPAAASPADLRGRWITASGNLEVEIAPCGEPARLCGTVTRVLGNRSMAPGGGDMQPVDARPALGLRILDALVPEDGDERASPPLPPTRWRGTLYNRENGKTYRCTLQVSSTHNAAGELLLRAYVGLPLFGQSQTWQRAPAAQRADAAASAAAAR